MSKIIAHSIAVTCAALTVAFISSSAHATEPTQTLWFADRQVSAFYAIDNVDHRLIVVTEPGPQGVGQTIRTERSLADGDHVAIYQGGNGDSAVGATLNITRSGNDVNVQISTTLQESAARDHP